jgi:epoxyqueuosine reductase
VSERIEDRLKAKAHAMGFELAGIARAGEADGFARFREWLDRGYAGEMEYLHRHADPRRHPESILEDVRSVLMLGVTYWSGLTPSPPEAGGARNPAARIAKYALGPDYHRFLWDKLNELGAWLDAEVPGTRSRGIADSAPLLERDFARRAGLGWIGKNTMLLNKQHGSFFLLCALLTTLQLQPDPPHEGEHCGTCTACLEACPTQAFPQPGLLDARRCVSYLTIELKTSIPEELRPGVGDWLFGCDVCQDVCPWNHRPNVSPGLFVRPDLVAIDPVELLRMAPNELRQRFKGTSLRRANWRGLLRNAAIVLGNRRDARALPALREALKWGDDVVREACEWALRQIEPNTSCTVPIPAQRT